jgi:hypothetical protein
MRIRMRRSIPLPGPFYISFGGRRRRRTTGRHRGYSVTMPRDPSQWWRKRSEPS